MMLLVKKQVIKITATIVVVIFIFGLASNFKLSNVYAEEGKTNIIGDIYKFASDCDYEFENNESCTKTNDSDDVVGQFSVSGNVYSITEIQGIPYYIVDNGSLTISYVFGNQMDKTDEEWHIVEDDEKKVDVIQLDSSIKNGVLILQTSRDGKKWSSTYVEENIFENEEIRTEPIYETTDIELKNGCYYRLIVAYKKGIKTGESKILFVNLGDKYEYQRFAEVYTFCACDKESAEKNTDNNSLKYKFEDFIKVKNDSGYSTEEKLNEDDPHYSHKLGNFYVEGYTSQTKDTEGNIVFLFNPGDEMSLYFNLQTDIDALWNDSNLSITDDVKGYDSQFQVELTDMGRGVLIVQHTDSNNDKTPISPYKDYLVSCTSAQSDTVVLLKEEGDYKVALDYKIKNKTMFGTDILPSYTSYRIYFEFSVRNGNCMIYPMDASTGSELANSSFAPNGFYISFANSKYLKINVKKEILSSDGNYLIEDTRFNKPAKENDVFTEEGIYTLTAHNDYTNQDTVKTIYVGNNDVLKAYAATGMPISEINALIEQGATIDENGNIKLTTLTMTKESQEEISSEIESNEEPSSPDTASQQDYDANNSDTDTGSIITFIMIAALLVAVVVIVVLVGLKKKKEK